MKRMEEVDARVVEIEEIVVIGMMMVLWVEEVVAMEDIEAEDVEDIVVS